MIYIYNDDGELEEYAPDIQLSNGESGTLRDTLEILESGRRGFYHYLGWSFDEVEELRPQAALVNGERMLWYPRVRKDCHSRFVPCTLRQWARAARGRRPLIVEKY